jgi:hypothetical protein
LQTTPEGLSADSLWARREAEAAARIEAAKAITFGAAAKRFIKPIGQAGKMPSTPTNGS